MRSPYAMTLTEVRGSLTTAGSGAGTTTDIRVTINGANLFTTDLTIDAGDKTSVGASTPPVLAITSIPDDAEIIVSIAGTTTGATESGLKLTFNGYI